MEIEPDAARERRVGREPLAVVAHPAVGAERDGRLILPDGPGERRGLAQVDHRRAGSSRRGTCTACRRPADQVAVRLPSRATRRCPSSTNELK